ncbi:hypothetical protein OSTOST_23331, partial [Ostertagia ostertagi]
MIVLNNPNNPTGKLYSREELEAIAEMARDFNLIVVADEVYEWHVWNKKMIRFASLPGMYDRTISIGSAGKSVLCNRMEVGLVCWSRTSLDSTEEDTPELCFHMQYSNPRGSRVRFRKRVGLF